MYYGTIAHTYYLAAVTGIAVGADSAHADLVGYVVLQAANGIGVGGGIVFGGVS